MISFAYTSSISDNSMFRPAAFKEHSVKTFSEVRVGNFTGGILRLLRL